MQKMAHKTFFFALKLGALSKICSTDFGVSCQLCTVPMKTLNEDCEAHADNDILTDIEI